MPPTEVTCPAGTIVGTLSGGVRRFESIPFARVEGAFDDPRPQEQGLLIDATLPHPGPLRLSITAPAGVRSLADLPVMVWIHGGRFEEGDHTETWMRPAAFAEAGVVHVRVGYRLKFPGLLPFAADPPGHFRAVADCGAALGWLQRSIEAFGGDPTNVTVVGQSAGAALVLWLCRRDHYRGEFRRALAMSPAFPRHGFGSRKWAARAALGKPLTRGALNGVSPTKLDHAYQRFRTHYLTDMALGPSPLDASELAEVPLVITCTDREFHHSGARFDRLGPGAAAAAVRTFGPHMGLRRAAASDYIAAVRREGVSHGVSGGGVDPALLAGQLMSDSLCRRFVDRVAEGAPGPVWLAEHTGPSKYPKQHGLSHAEDLDFLFAPDPWLLDFVRTGEVGWPQYVAGHCERATRHGESVAGHGESVAGHGESVAGHGESVAGQAEPTAGEDARLAARRNVATGEVEVVSDPLGYLREAFTFAEE